MIALQGRTATHPCETGVCPLIAHSRQLFQAIHHRVNTQKSITEPKGLV